VRQVEPGEFVALLVSRRSLERLDSFPRRARLPSGLRDRRTGVVYLSSVEPARARATESIAGSSWGSGSA
jgi:hypothetical protein